MENLCSVILAAGEGKRMKSGYPKVLSEVLFKSMIKWVIEAAQNSNIEDICVVTGFRHETVEEYLLNESINCETVIQHERKGTAHAVTMADSFLRKHSGGHVLILGGDSPFIDSNTVKQAYKLHISNKNAATVISAKLENPFGYGRIVRDNSTSIVTAIIEQKDADSKVKVINEVNSGAYWFDIDALLSVIYNISNDTAQGEYYLPDALKLLINKGMKIDAFAADSSEIVLGANDCSQLKELNRIAIEKGLDKALMHGVNIPCADGVIIDNCVEFGKNVRILPGSVITGNTKIGDNCTIGPNTQIQNSIVEDNVILNSCFCLNSLVKKSDKLGPFSSVINNKRQD